MFMFHCCVKGDRRLVYLVFKREMAILPAVSLDLNNAGFLHNLI